MTFFFARSAIEAGRLLGSLVTELEGVGLVLDVDKHSIWKLNSSTSCNQRIFFHPPHLFPQKLQNHIEGSAKLCRAGMLRLIRLYVDSLRVGTTSHHFQQVAHATS